MVKKLNISELILDINKDLPATEEELRERASEKVQATKERNRALRDEDEVKAEQERTTEPTGEDRRRPSTKLGKFASKKTLAGKKNEFGGFRLKRGQKPSVTDSRLQTKDEVILEIQAKEQQSEDFVNLVVPRIEETPPETEIISVGRLLRIVPSDSFGVPQNEFLRRFDPSLDEVFTVDALRGRAGNYWSVDDKQKQFMFLSDSSQVRTESSYTMFFRNAIDVNEDTDFGRTEEWVDLRSKIKKFRTAKKNYSKAYWRSFVEGRAYAGSTEKGGKTGGRFTPTIKQNQNYFDYVHQMPIPFSQKDLIKMNTPLNALAASVTPEYNFFIKGYENKITNDGDVLENTLPNMYAFLSELNCENANPDFKNFITLDDTLVVEDKLFTRKEKREGFDIKEHPIGQYYDLYSRQYNEAKSNGAVTRLNRRFSNMLLAIDDVSLIKDFNEKREMFPMFMDINFSTDKTTTFAQMLKDTNLSNAFVSRMVNRIIENQASIMAVQQSVETIIQKNQGSNPSKVASFTDKQKRYWDISNIIKDLLETEEELNSEQAIYLGEYENEIKTLSGKEFDFFKTLMFTIFFGKLQKLIKQKFRSFEEIMDGKPAYSETVFYRVTKFEGRPGGRPQPAGGARSRGRAIQNYFFPNSNEIDALRFIDTQVKYDKEYSYVIYAYQLVIGNRYWYTDVDVDSFDQHATFKTTQEPSLILMEHEIFSYTGRILDDPPITPEINMVPYKGIDNRVLLLLNSAVGNFVTDPIAIKPEDNLVFQKLRAKRQIDSGKPIRFKADDHVSTFEIYRLDEHPEKYEDFNDNLRATVQTDVNLKSLQAATAASFVDAIQPNKKYYYTFRAIDNHGNMSNPSPIIRIEMINDQGTVFLLKSVVDFAEKEKMTTKPMRRYVQLVPNVLQTLINEEKSGFDEAESATELKSKLHLGVSDDAVWGKKFRIRLISKSTGKKIDFKINFEHEHKKKA